MPSPLMLRAGSPAACGNLNEAELPSLRLRILAETID